MSPFSSLARQYSQSLRKFTLTGTATLNRRIFIDIYAKIRPSAISERAIRAGWKRTGLHPFNKQRILDDEEVKAFGCITSEYQSAPLSESPNGVYLTLKKFEKIRAIISQIKATSTPLTQRAIRKLGNATL
jgi:hypothetical protein